LKSTTEHTEYTEAERRFYSVISVASVVIPDAGMHATRASISWMNDQLAARKRSGRR
jgi:hypothetical protein